MRCRCSFGGRAGWRSCAGSIADGAHAAQAWVEGLHTARAAQFEVEFQLDVVNFCYSVHRYIVNIEGCAGILAAGGSAACGAVVLPLLQLHFFDLSTAHIPGRYYAQFRHA